MAEAVDRAELQKSLELALTMCQELRTADGALVAGNGHEEITIALASLNRIKSHLGSYPLPDKSHRFKPYSILIALNRGVHSLPADLKSLITYIEDVYSRKL